MYKSRKQIYGNYTDSASLVYVNYINKFRFGIQTMRLVFNENYHWNWNWFVIRECIASILTQGIFTAQLLLIQMCGFPKTLKLFVCRQTGSYCWFMKQHSLLYTRVFCTAITEPCTKPRIPGSDVSTHRNACVQCCAVYRISGCTLLH
jgi:hypothetical protein